MSKRITLIIEPATDDAVAATRGRWLMSGVFWIAGVAFWMAEETRANAFYSGAAHTYAISRVSVDLEAMWNRWRARMKPKDVN